MARDVQQAVLSILATAAAVWVAIGVSDQISVDGPWWVVVAVLAMAAAESVLRPTLGLLVDRAGPLAALVLGVAAQIAVLDVTLLLLPGIHLQSWLGLMQVLLFTAGASAVARWLVSVNDSRWIVARLLRVSARRQRRSAGAPAFVGPAPATGTADAPAGLLIVQIDGLPFPLLELGLLSGTLPTLARWVRSGSHSAREWRPEFPCTTPVSQAGLLHGRSGGIPGFRWWDAATGRVLVANRPDDAAVVQARLSDGTGLLAGGGASIANLWSGDAEHNVMVVGTAASGLGSGKPFLYYFLSPFVLSRSLLLSIGEIVKELYQGWQQRVRGVEPRIRRRGAYLLLRAITCGILRDLTVALVAEHLVRGTPVVYVDFMDYDEVAHHAGPVRAESLDALSGLDRVLGTLQKVAETAPRRYEIVVLSDHGQSQGATFQQVSGRTLRELLSDLLQVPDSVPARHAHQRRAQERSVGKGTAPPVPDPRAAHAHLAPATGSGSAGGAKASDGGELRGRVDTLAREVGGEPGVGLAARPQRPADDDIVVLGAGCVGLVWFDARPRRTMLEEIEQRWPRLLPGLLHCPGVGFVLVHTDEGPVALGARGRRHLAGDRCVVGTDPMGALDVRASAELARVAAFDTAPDLLVHSSVDADTGEVHAFEEQVGSHGGFGGWQNRAVLVHPARWAVDADLLQESAGGPPTLVGSQTVHRQLVRWMAAAGLR